MRSKLSALLFWFAAAADLVAVGTLYWIWHAPQWHEHLFRFIGRCWVNFLNLEGSSGNGFISGLLVAFLEVLVLFAIANFMHEGDSIKNRLMHLENLGIGLCVLLFLVVAVYGTQFAWEVAKTGDQEHRSLAAQNLRLGVDEASWKKQATDVASVVCNPLKEPKLVVFINGMEANKRTIGYHTTNQSGIVQIPMVVKNIGTADATAVILRVYLRPGYENPSNFDVNWQKVSSDDASYTEEDYSANGLNPPLIRMGEPLAWPPFLLRAQKGAPLGHIPVKVVLFASGSKPTAVNFWVNIEITNSENK